MSSIDSVALSLLPFAWRREIAERLRSGRAARAVLDELVTEKPRRREVAPAVLRKRAGRALAAGGRAGLGTIGWSDEAYPPLLAAIIDPPPFLWFSGSLAALQAPAVAIVGSRGGSPYALAVAERFAADLAARGLTIVSGLARGVDSAAHRGALSVGGVTIAVLGSGADVIYPPEHARLGREIAVRGLVLSELPPGTPPRPQFFPLRNRLISGLCRAVIVVEAGEKSGSLITARCALDQGRDVLAVPGNVLTGRNKGGHALLRDGARVAETVEDVLEELNMRDEAAAARRQDASDARGTERGDVVLACLIPGESCDLDVISARSGLSAAQLLPRLLELELEGRVRRAESGRFVRFDSSC